MAAVISTGLLTTGLRSEFFETYRGEKTWYSEWATRIASTAASESYRWLGTVPSMRQMVEGRMAAGMRTESYSIENLKYEATIEVDRDELADDQTGQIRIRIGELAKRAARHKDYLISQLLVNGGTAGNISYDGVSFFNDAHVSGSSGSQDNALTYDASDHTAVTTAEFKASLQAAIQQMLTFKDDRGEPMTMGMGGLVCVVPPQLYFAAAEATSAAIIANTSNVLSGVASVVALPWLTLGTTWYLLKTDGVVRPFIFQDREPIEFAALDAPDSEAAFTRERYLYGVRARYRMAYGYWQYAVRTVFT